jgi:cell division protein FtsI/penicillin-binding protein 2
LKKKHLVNTFDEVFFMRKRRVYSLLLLFTISMALLMGRLMEIQLFKTEAFSKHHVNLLKESVRQRSQELVLDDGRGRFLDKNGESLTGKKISVLVLFPFLKKMTEELHDAAAILGVTSQSLSSAVERAHKPIIFGGESSPFVLTPSQVKRINNLKIPGMIAVEKIFERPHLTSEQLIGLVGENAQTLKSRYPEKKLSEKTRVGVSGLEQSFDEFLLPEGESKLVYHVDGAGSPLFGLQVRYVDPANPFYPVNIRTTIDKTIQERAEQLVDAYHIKKGGLVLLDLNDNSILAMVSRPNMDKLNPYKGNGISNMMVKQQIIGSVFKTVTAAAAIDYNLTSPARLFNCSQKINGEKDLIYHYGMLNFTDSFARSCNHTFGQLARELTKINPHILEEYAAKLSLLGPVGWQGTIYHSEHFKQLRDEDKGRVFLTNSEKADANFISQTGIGQQEVRATPLAVANMMAVIAKGGKKEMIRAVSKIEFKNGTGMLEFHPKELGGATISPFTAVKLQKLLREVVINQHGTGRWLQHLPYDIAGKSGTAETGKYDNSRQLHNKWFAGYFPYQHPRYALVTVNLDVYENKGGVNQLFESIVNMLYELDNKS